VGRPVDTARLPMRKLKSTAASPKEYIIIPLTFGSHGTFDFLLDTGSSTTLVSPYIAHSKLGIPPGSGQLSRGLGGMGDGNLDMRRISLPAMSIGGTLCKPVEVCIRLRDHCNQKFCKSHLIMCKVVPSVLVACIPGIFLKYSTDQSSVGCVCLLLSSHFMLSCELFSVIL
jgi:hypothetical protein